MKIFLLSLMFLIVAGVHAQQTPEQLIDEFYRRFNQQDCAKDADAKAAQLFVEYPVFFGEQGFFVAGIDRSVAEVLQERRKLYFLCHGLYEDYKILNSYKTERNQAVSAIVKFYRDEYENGYPMSLCSIFTLALVGASWKIVNWHSYPSPRHGGCVS
jgi:hypothetical protein